MKQAYIQLVRESAKTMHRYADDMDRCADKMEERDDLEYLGEAMLCVTNMLNNLRLDLFVSRPVREIAELRAEREA